MFEEEAMRKLYETQEQTKRLRKMWRGVGMRIEEAAPFTILAIQALLPEFGDTPRSDLVSVGDVLCSVNAVDTLCICLCRCLDTRSMLPYP